MEPLIVSGTLDSLNPIAQYILKAASVARVDKKTTYQLRLAVDEIATNIITHGYEEAGLRGSINIQAHIDEYTLKISIKDTGLPYDPTQNLPQINFDQPLEARPLGGLGIYLALQGVDELIYQRTLDHNCTLLIIRRAAETSLPNE